MTDAPDQIWWSAAELAAANLPDLPRTKRGVNDLAGRQGWSTTPGKARRRKAKGGGTEFHWTVLPLRARQALLARVVPPDEKPTADAVWASYDGLKESAKAKAAARLEAIQQVETLEAAGVTRNAAVDAVRKANGTSAKTLWNWLAMIEGVAVADRLAYLAPQYAKGKRAKAQIDPDFLSLIKSDYLRLEKPTLTSCHERASRIAKTEGIPVAPLSQVRRRLQAELSPETLILCREGREALRRHYPHQTRDKSALRVMQAVQADFHRFDVFVNWPGEARPVRPQGVFFSDIHSGMMLSYRLDVTPNRHAVQLALGDMVERYGIPEEALLDNGREFATKYLTGGAPTRFRFKVKEDDVPGLFPLLGMKIHWATPYRGQSKPIERAFRDFCDRVSKHPAFAGAYTGNNPTAKPENYASRAVDLDAFRAVLAEEVQAHNARPNRRSEVAFGTSFEAVFNAGYKTGPIRKATEEQRRLWLTGAEGLRAKRGNGELSLMDNRYWAPWMSEIQTRKVLARFDPDDLHAGLHVYDLDGRYLGHAGILEKSGFFDVQSARDIERKRAMFIRSEKRKADAHRVLTEAELAARLGTPDAPVSPDALPEADVVKLSIPHAKAPKQAQTLPSFERASIARLDDRRATDPEDSAADLYDRALGLEARLADGETLTDAQAAWLREFQTSAKYRSQKKLRQSQK